MKNFLFLTVFLFPVCGYSQYYYQDIMSNRQTNREYQTLKNNNIHRVILKSFDASDEPIADFFCEKEFSDDFSMSSMKSKSVYSAESLLTATYKEGRITRAVTTTSFSRDTIRFEYDDVGNLSLIAMTTFGNADSISFSEERKYSYNDKGMPTKMVRTRNGLKDLAIVFISGEHGNIIEEHEEGHDAGSRFYYYYDAQDRLTDVVHFNALANKLLPDYMFQYHDLSLPSQMLSVDNTSTDYLIWKYSYTPTGLPEIQKCYSKEKQLLGTIQYEYQ